MDSVSQKSRAVHKDRAAHAAARQARHFGGAGAAFSLLILTASRRRLIDSRWNALLTPLRSLMAGSLPLRYEHNP